MVIVLMVSFPSQLSDTGLNLGPVDRIHACKFGAFCDGLS